jgi:hypothetical protein
VKSKTADPTPLEKFGAYSLALLIIVPCALGLYWCLWTLMNFCLGQQVIGYWQFVGLLFLVNWFVRALVRSAKGVQP